MLLDLPGDKIALNRLIFHKMKSVFWVSRLKKVSDLTQTTTQNYLVLPFFFFFFEV